MSDDANRGGGTASGAPASGRRAVPASLLWGVALVAILVVMQFAFYLLKPAAPTDASTVPLPQGAPRPPSGMDGGGGPNAPGGFGGAPLPAPGGFGGPPPPIPGGMPPQGGVNPGASGRPGAPATSVLSQPSTAETVNANAGNGPGGVRVAEETELPMEVMPSLVVSIMRLDGSQTPLTSNQKARLTTIASHLMQSMDAIQLDLQRSVAVLSPTQLPTVYESHPSSAGTLSADLALKRAISVLEPRAGSSQAPPVPLLPRSGSLPMTLPPSLQLSEVAGGIIYLETTADRALSPAQARTVLEGFRHCLAQVHQVMRDESEIARMLTPAQKQAIQALDLGVPDNYASAIALKLWCGKQ